MIHDDIFKQIDEDVKKLTGEYPRIKLIIDKSKTPRDYADLGIIDVGCGDIIRILNGEILPDGYHPTLIYPERWMNITELFPFMDNLRKEQVAKFNLIAQAVQIIGSIEAHCIRVVEKGTRVQTNPLMDDIIEALG